ncbi:MAG TPA: hypothetical protein VF587_03190 [Solirubrobacteraceae bacterium]
MSPHLIDPPLRRPLKIFALDPMRSRGAPGGLSVDIANEVGLQPGPCGERVRVVDYDGVQKRFYEPVDLDDPAILMQGGLDPTESDPRFHQQMVYAVTMRTLENFDRALGRKITFRGDKLLLVPHAFVGPNAFFEPNLKAVCFGYFPADTERPGENIPGQPIFTCLSHDIIAHEVTHALVHRMRQRFGERTNPDVLAFHEAFSDIVAIFQHFSFPSVLRDAIRKSRGNLRRRTDLVDLAAQFGHATGRGESLRTAITKPDPQLYLSTTESHARGSILVAAVFAGFFAAYQRRVEDLMRLATGGSGVLPRGELSPDLVDRLAREAAASAQSTLTMCIRAFEYLPPVDVTFGDFLRALVTADHDLQAEAGAVERNMMVDAFRERGIYATGVGSLAEAALCWPPAPDIPLMPTEFIRQQVLSDANQLDRYARATQGAAAGALSGWAKQNAEVLGLDPTEKIDPDGFHATFRVAQTGELRVEVVAQFVQDRRDDVPELRGMPLRGGATVVASADGRVRFVIAKPLDDRERVDRQLGYVRRLDAGDPAAPWAKKDEQPKLSGQMLRLLHGAARS